MSVLMAVTLSGFSLGESIGRSRSDQEERKVENRERSTSDSLCLIKNLQKSRLKKNNNKKKKKGQLFFAYLLILENKNRCRLICSHINMLSSTDKSIHYCFN